MESVERKIKMMLKVVKLRENAKIPFRATVGSAGMDLSACMDAPVTIAPGELKKIPTGIAIGLPGPNTVGLIFARSGLAVKNGVTLSNAVGVIDSDYTGELIVGLCNVGSVPYTIQPGERIAQLVIMPVLTPRVAVVDHLQATSRGDGGFGSTGK